MGKRKQKYYTTKRKWGRKELKKDCNIRLPFQEIQNLQMQQKCSEQQRDNEKSSSSEPEFTIEKELEEEGEILINGNRIFDCNYLFEQLKEISHHNSPLDCNFSHLTLIGERNNGFVTKFFFVCKLCNVKLKLNNCRTTEKNQGLDLNEKMVSSIMSIGAGYSALEQISASLDIACMSDKLYAKCHARVCELWELAKEKCIAEAAKEEFDLAIQHGDVNADGVPIIIVVADACWSKRSYRKNYSALSGAAVIIGFRTKKVLYMAVKNKYCMVCARSENRSEPIPEHVCFKNYTGSSSAMESVAIVEGFQSSLKNQGLIYAKLIADGDSSTYKKILDARPYGNIIVEKIECTNHLLRNFCTKLDELTKNTSYPIKQRKLLGNNILRLRRAVKGAVNQISSQENKSFDNKVLVLKQDLLNAPNHVFGDHSACKPYFCNKNNVKTTDPTENLVPQMQESLLFAAIRKIMSRLVNNAKSLMHNVNSNIAEVFNSIVAKFVGGKRINFSGRQSYTCRCAGSVVAFNSKKPHTYLYKHIFCRSPTKGIKKVEAKRNLKRMSVKKRISSFQPTRKSDQIATGDKDYGESCQRPDLSETDFEFAKSEHLQKLTKTVDERHALERRTVLQSDCMEWHQERRLRLTASVFGKVCKRGQIKCGPLVKSLLNDSSNLNHVKSIQHGRENEHVARQQLQKHLQCQEGSSSTIQSCGLFVDAELFFLGASPDGLIENDSIIEIKCPYSAANLSVQDGVNTKKITFWKKNKAGDVVMNKNHDWYYQAQGQLHITNRNKCIFAVWTSVDMKVEVIEKNDKMWKTMEEKLKMFYFDCLLPEIVDSRLERKMEVREPAYIIEALEKKISNKKHKSTENETDIKTKRKK